jgi:hypothetical protein
MHYTHQIRRRARLLRQLAVAASQPATQRHGVVVGAYWWVGLPNFGDDMTPWLLPRYGVVPVHRRAEEARVAGVGSILEHLPPDFSGAIWGAGLMDDHAYPLPEARILAVRGRLTAERIGAPEGVALGDPGLLAARRIRRPPIRWDVGLIPHLSHRSNSAFLALAEAPGIRVRVIDVRRTAGRTVREIASCAAVVTTSLHGLVTADAFGIPALWTSLEPPLSGGDFKFRDYESVVTPGRSRHLAFHRGASLQEMLMHAAPAPRSTVESASDGLEAALRTLPEVLGDLKRFPAGVPQVIAGRNE